MGEVTGIGWTDHTFNGWIGCTEVGPGCVPCYARELDRKYQYGVKGDARYDTIAPMAPNWGDEAPRYRTAPSNWKQPLKWNTAAMIEETPSKVFAHSLSDVFDNRVPDQWRADLFELWRQTPWLRWQVVTKRVSNIKKMLPPDWGVNGYPNVGLVITTVNQEEFDRDRPRLLSIPAAWHGFSIEPQLGPIIVPDEMLRGWYGSLWFITGGESAQGSRNHPMIDKDTGQVRVPVRYDPDWARALIGATRNHMHATVFVKQLGAKPISLPEPQDGMGKDPMAWPEDLRVQEFPLELLS